jgi:regulator of RNase E activity RraA
VVVIPAELGEQVALDAAEQEEMEKFLLARIAGGAPLPGTYPPNEATKAAYQAWRKARG